MPILGFQIKNRTETKSGHISFKPDEEEWKQKLCKLVRNFTSLLIMTDVRKLFVSSWIQLFHISITKSRKAVEDCNMVSYIALTDAIAFVEDLSMNVRKIRAPRLYKV